MKTLLKIDASFRSKGSHSRILTAAFEQSWLEANPGGTVIRRDLAQSNLPHLNERTVGDFLGAPTATSAMDSSVALSDSLIDELEKADEAVVGSPMYNFSTPSPLKAWVDHVVRSGRTFAVRDGAYQGLLGGKTAWLLTVRGGLDPGPADGNGPYLHDIFQFLGFSRVEWIALEGMAMGADQAGAAMTRALAEVKAWFQPQAVPTDGMEWSGVFTVADRAGINALRTAQAEAIMRGDAEAYASLCTEDIVLMLQGRDMVNGKAAFRECERSVFSVARFRAIRQTPTRIERQGALAVETGISEVKLDGVSSESANYTARRKYTHVLRKTAEGWRFAVLMSNNSH